MIVNGFTRISGPAVVNTPDGKGTVYAISVLKGIVSVKVDEGDEKEIKDYRLKDVKIIKRSSAKREEKVDVEELKQLED